MSDIDEFGIGVSALQHSFVTIDKWGTVEVPINAQPRAGNIMLTDLSLYAADRGYMPSASFMKEAYAQAIAKDEGGVLQLPEELIGAFSLEQNNIIESGMRRGPQMNTKL